VEGIVWHAKVANLLMAFLRRRGHTLAVVARAFGATVTGRGMRRIVGHAIVTQKLMTRFF